MGASLQRVLKEDAMNRRMLLALAAPLALAAEALVTGAAAQPAAAATSKGPPNPLFAEDDQFWFETVRMFARRWSATPRATSFTRASHRRCSTT